MDYTQHDYESLVNEISQRFSEVEGWTNAYQTTTGQRLIELFADTTDSLMYMLERRSQEAFISTAVLRRSVVAHASELGYRPRRHVSMTGTVEITLKDNDGNTVNAESDVVIERFTPITSVVSQIGFVTTERAVIKSGSSSTTINIKEGTHQQVSFQASDEIFTEHYDYVFEYYENIDEYSIEIDDSGVSYGDVENGDVVFGTLKYATNTDAVYDVKYGNDGMRIVFGNGTFGRAPVNTITIDYVESNGVITPFNTTGNRFVLEDNVVLDINETIPRKEYRYEILNTSAIRGGNLPETVAEIVDNAPESARVNNRCVSTTDFEYWGRRSGIGGLVDVNAYAESETGASILTMNNINIAYVTNDAQELTVEQTQQLLNYFSRYKVSWVYTALRKVNDINAVVNMYVRKESKLPLSSADFYSYIRSEVESYFTIERGSIGKSLQHSELTEYIQNLSTTVNGVTYDAVDFARIDIHPLYELKTPQEFFDMKIYLSQSYTPVTGDVWTITIDGTDVSVTVEDGDTVNDLVERMRSTVMQTVYIIALVEDEVGSNVLRLRSRNINNSFTIDISGGDLSASTSTKNVIVVPANSLNLAGLTDVIVPGSVQIVRSDMGVYLQDDGNGVLNEDVNGTLTQRATIDYKYFTIEGLILPIEPEETFYVKYHQNKFQNIDVDDESVVVLSPFADGVNDDPLYSTIEVV